MIRVHLPRDLAAEHGLPAVVEVSPAASTVAGVLAALGQRQPEIARRLLEVDGSIRPHLNVFVDGVEVRSAGGTATAVGDGQELWVVRAVSGGA